MKQWKLATKIKVAELKFSVNFPHAIYYQSWHINLTFFISVTFYKNDNICPIPLLFFLQAFDADTGKDSVLIYQLLNNNNMFSINQTTGWITTKQLLAGQKGLLFELNVEVTDNDKKGEYSTDVAVVEVRSLKMSYYGDLVSCLWF